jgi:hyperosmotically inducible periplasmic protein
MHLISKKQRNRLSFQRIAANGLIVASLGLLGPSSALFARQAPPDNTKANQGQTTTADQQAENPADRELSQKIRKSLMDDKNLSVYAHNIKIITKDGVVRLKGPVRTDEERAAIEAKAVAIAGPNNVKNELTVKPQ